MRQESNQQQTAVNRFCVSSILGKQRKQLLQADERKETLFSPLHGIDFSSKIYPVHLID